jgi:hypothetical protein
MGGQPTGIRRHRARLIDAPSVLFACDPFADVPLTECSMMLCGQRDSVTTQVMRSRRPAG